MRRWSEHGLWRGSKRELEARGWASWPRIPVMCVSAHASVHDEGGEGGTDREGPRRREREREKRGHAGNDSAPGSVGPRDREKRGAHGRSTWHRPVGPSWQRARERERACGRESSR
jgi:hypothetical protein